MFTNQKIKVAQVITRLDWGGSPDIFRVLCEHLNPGIYDITVIVGETYNLSARTKRFLRMFHGRTISVPPLKRDIDISSDTIALAQLYGIFRKERFDVVHTHTAKAGALGRLAAGLARVPAVVHTPHGHNFYGYFSPGASSAIMKIEKFLAKFTDRIVALTELEKSDYVNFGISNPGRISVIYQGIDLDKFARDRKDTRDLKSALGIRSEDPVIGMAGRLEPVKGSMFFIEAASEISKKFPEARFIVAGEGSLRIAMENRSRELGLSQKIIFTGWIEDMREVLPVFDVMVMPSLNEAVGMALIEAQAQEVPVVATKVGGIPEVVIDNKTGILVPPSDPAGMAGAVCGLLADKKRRAEMGEAGRMWVYDKFNAEAMADKTSALYMEILHKKRRFG
jgi:glycosyltransferase involved in cell wall biosynthesis